MRDGGLAMLGGSAPVPVEAQARPWWQLLAIGIGTVASVATIYSVIVQQRQMNRLVRKLGRR